MTIGLGRRTGWLRCVTARPLRGHSEKWGRDCRQLEAPAASFLAVFPPGVGAAGPPKAARGGPDIGGPGGASGAAGFP
jgi:hypothetical protein